MKKLLLSILIVYFSGVAYLATVAHINTGEIQSFNQIGLWPLNVLTYVYNIIVG